MKEITEYQICQAYKMLSSSDEEMEDLGMTIVKEWKQKKLLHPSICGSPSSGSGHYMIDLECEMTRREGNNMIRMPELVEKFIEKYGKTRELSDSEGISDVKI